jgi:hypothetical protein
MDGGSARLRSADAASAFSQRIRNAHDAHVRDNALYRSGIGDGVGIARRISAEPLGPLQPPAATERERSAFTTFMERMRAAQVRKCDVD